LKVRARSYGCYLPVLHDHRVEERTSQAMPLGCISVVPSCASVQDIPLETIQNLRLTVVLGFSEAGKLCPKVDALRLILPLR
jgi:hypothetical protein